jgi:hypothetical protein
MEKLECNDVGFGVSQLRNLATLIRCEEYERWAPLNSITAGALLTVDFDGNLARFTCIIVAATWHGGVMSN